MEMVSTLIVSSNSCDPSSLEESFSAGLINKLVTKSQATDRDERAYNLGQENKQVLHIHKPSLHKTEAQGSAQALAILKHHWQNEHSLDIAGNISKFRKFPLYFFFKRK